MMGAIVMVTIAQKNVHQKSPENRVIPALGLTVLTQLESESGRTGIREAYGMGLVENVPGLPIVNCTTAYGCNLSLNGKRRKFRNFEPCFLGKDEQEH